MRKLTLMLFGFSAMLWIAPAAQAKTTGTTCDDFTYQEQAQAAFDANPTGLARFDRDKDGKACENRPSQTGAQGGTRTAKGGRDRDCRPDFRYQEDAQAVYDRDRSDPNRLDRNKNRVACEDLPHRPTGTTSGSTGGSGGSGGSTTAGITVTGNGPGSGPPSSTPGGMRTDEGTNGGAHELPYTGSRTVPLLVAGLTLLVGGAGALTLARRPVGNRG